MKSRLFVGVGGGRREPGRGGQGGSRRGWLSEAGQGPEQTLGGNVALFAELGRGDGKAGRLGRWRGGRRRQVEDGGGGGGGGWPVGGQGEGGTILGDGDGVERFGRSLGLRGGGGQDDQRSNAVTGRPEGKAGDQDDRPTGDGPPGPPPARSGGGWRRRGGGPRHRHPRPHRGREPELGRGPELGRPTRGAAGSATRAEPRCQRPGPGSPGARYPGRW